MRPRVRGASALPRSPAGQNLSVWQDRNTGRMSIVQSRPVTTQLGGVTGRGFRPGRSGNPGGRPKGLTEACARLVGDNGEAIAEFMYEVMNDEAARTADRLEAAKWLADRAFGRSVQAVDIDVNPSSVDISHFSTEDLNALAVILRSTHRTQPSWPSPGSFGSVRVRSGRLPSSGNRRYLSRSASRGELTTHSARYYKVLPRLGARSTHDPRRGRVRFSVRFLCQLLSSRGAWPIQRTRTAKPSVGSCLVLSLRALSLPS